MDAFIELFGDVKILTVVVFCAAIYFMYKVYRSVSNFIIQKHEEEENRNNKIEEAVTETRNLPKYRQQSIEVQEHLETEIQEVRDVEKSIIEELNKLSSRLERMEEDMRRRERNQTRDILLKHYRYYTQTAKSWTTMEAEAFWELFGDYEKAGGDGYMHTIVQPEMNKLPIIDV